MKRRRALATVLFLVLCSELALCEDLARIPVRREGAPTTVEVDGETRVVEKRVYDVKPLLESLEAAGSEVDVEELAELLIGTVAGEAPYDDETGYVRPGEGELVVLVSAPAHEAVLRLLEDLLNRGRGSALETPAGTAKIEAALDKRLACDFEDASAAEVAGFLAKAIGVPVQVDPALGEGDYPIRLSVKDAAAKDLLRFLVYAAGGQAEIGDGAIRITNRTRLATRVYELRDLLRRHRDPDEPRSAEEVVEIVFSCAPEGWDDEEHRMVPWQEMLIVTQTRAVHRRIEKLLGALRGTGSRGGVPTVTRLDEADPSELEQLKRPVSLGLAYPALGEVLATIRVQAGLDIAISPESQHVAEMENWLPRIRGIQACDVLDLLRDHFSIDWGVRGGIVVVGELGALPEQRIVRVYDVSGLLQAAQAESLERPNPEEGLTASVLRESSAAILADIVADSFASRIIVADFTLLQFDGTFVLCSSRGPHAAMVRVLAALHARGGPKAETPAWVRDIEKKLQTPIQWAVDEVPLHEALTNLGDKLGVNILVHPDLGIEEELLSLYIPDGSTPEDVLYALAKNYGAQVVFRNGAMMFSTNRVLETRVHDVRGIVRWDARTGRRPGTAEELQDRVGDVADRIRNEFLEKWSDEGLNSLGFWDEMLIVHESAGVQEAIARRLDKLRSGGK